MLSTLSLPIALLTLFVATKTLADADANPAPTSAPLPSEYGGEFPSSLLGTLTPASFETSLFDSVTGTNYWPFVETNTAGENTYIPTNTALPFVAQTTNAGNPPHPSATQAPSMQTPGQDAGVTDTTMPLQTGNMAAGRVGNSVGLGGPAAAVLGAAVMVGGAML